MGTASPPPPQGGGTPPAVTYQVGGTLTGLPTGTSVALALGGQMLVLSANGSFAAPTRLSTGAAFTTSVTRSPEERECRVSNGTGTVSAADIGNIAVDCGFGLNWIPDGTVRGLATSADGSTVYLAGEFSRVGPQTGTFIATNAQTGELRRRLPGGTATWQNVDFSVSDGQGGRYVYLSNRSTRSFEAGGVFRLVRIDAQGQLDARFAPPNLRSVTAMTVQGGTIYVVAQPNNPVGQESVYAIRALDAVTGAAGSFVKPVAGIVNSLAVQAGVLYAGGSLSISRTPEGVLEYESLLAVNLSTGDWLDWRPIPQGTSASREGSVLAMQMVGDRLVVGGGFLRVDGSPRLGLAAFALPGRTLLGWNPAGVERVRIAALATQGGQMLVAGSFDRVGGAARKGLAQVDLETGLASAWDAGLDTGGVRAIALGGNSVYAVGDFSSAGGQPRRQVAALAADTGAVLPFVAAAGSGMVRSVSVHADELWLGGDFSVYGGVPRRALAAIDMRSGEATSWDPARSRLRRSRGSMIERVGDAIAVVGGFERLATGATENFALLDAGTGAELAFTPTHDFSNDGFIRAMAVQGSRVYLMGSFTRLGGAPRNGLAAVDAVTGRLSEWQAEARGGLAIAASASRVYVRADTRVLAFDTSSGARVAFNTPVLNDANSPLANGTQSLFLRGDRLYVGGLVQVNGANQNIVALNAGNGELLPWAVTPGRFTGYTTLFVDTAGKPFGMTSSSSPTTGTPFFVLSELDLVTGTEAGLRLQLDGAVNALVGARTEGYFLGGSFGLEGAPRQALWPWKP